MNAIDYDETEALKCYFNDNYQALMSLEERQSLDLSWYRLAARRPLLKVIGSTLRDWLSRFVGRSRSKAGFESNTDGENYEEILQQHLQTATDRVKRASLAAPAEIQRQIDARILRDYEDGTLHVNRCSECQRIARTPLAKQCLWCGHDWFGA